MSQRGSSHLILIGLLVSSLGALLLVTGCASQLPDGSSQGPIPASSTPSRVVLEPGIHAESTEPPEVASGVEEQRMPTLVMADGDQVEEVVVVANRVRRWLPIVGHAWPDKDCRLSVRVVGAGVRRSVFVADLGRSGQAWRHVAQNLATEGEEHVLVTLPGSAGNRPCTWRGAVLQDASRLVAELLGDGGGAVSLIGDAFGGQVALKVASNVDPDRIHNVVLFDVVPYPWEVAEPIGEGISKNVGGVGLGGACRARLHRQSGPIGSHEDAWPVGPRDGELRVLSWNRSDQRPPTVG